MRSQFEEAEQSPVQSIHIFGFTFPDCEHLPAEPPKPANAHPIPLDIPAQFQRPIGDSRLGSPPILTGLMLMPKTTVNEDDLSSSRKYQIRRPRQASLMKRVTVSEAMQKSAHNEFRLRVLGPNPAHDFTAPCWRDSIHRLGLPVSRYNLAIGSLGSTTKWPSARKQERR